MKLSETLEDMVVLRRISFRRQDAIDEEQLGRETQACCMYKFRRVSLYDSAIRKSGLVAKSELWRLYYPRRKSVRTDTERGGH